MSGAAASLGAIPHSELGPAAVVPVLPEPGTTHARTANTTTYLVKRPVSLPTVLDLSEGGREMRQLGAAPSTTMGEIGRFRGRHVPLLGYLDPHSGERRYTITRLRREAQSQFDRGRDVKNPVSELRRPGSAAARRLLEHRRNLLGREPRIRRPDQRGRPGDLGRRE